jgi:anti-sigma regulatory factor (Ser/Thr protein kinase)
LPTDAAGNVPGEEATLAPTVQLQLDSRPESVALVRAMLAGAAELLDFGPELLADLKTAVSEVCNNAVLHAYPDAPGPLSVGLLARPDTVEVTVVDHGSGLEDPAADGGVSEPGGVGFAVINALAAEAQFSPTDGGGTTVRMVFSRRRADLPQVEPAPEPGTLEAAVRADGEVVVSVAPVELLSGILGRVAGCVAAEAHFSIDRYSDLYLVTDGLSAHARTHASGGRITAALAARPREINLTLGPLVAGTAAQLRSSTAGIAPQLLGLLIDDLAIEPRDGSEAVRLMLQDRPHVA